MPTERLQDHCTDGSNARSDGKPITDCPRNYGRLAAWWWTHGWRLEDERIAAFSDGAPRANWRGKLIGEADGGIGGLGECHPSDSGRGNVTKSDVIGGTGGGGYQ